MAGCFLHTEGIVSCNWALALESAASQLTTHGYVDLDCCLKTHCCNWVHFQSAHSEFPTQPNTNYHRQESVIILINHQKCGSRLKIHVVTYTRYPKWNKCKKWNQSWAGNHLAHVFTNISKSTLWSTLQQQSHSYAQDSARTKFSDNIQVPSGFPTNSHYFFLFPEIIFPFLHKFHRYEPKGLKNSQMWNFYDSQPISAHVRTCPLMSTHHAW